MKFPAKLRTRWGFTFVFIVFAAVYGLSMVLSGYWTGPEGINGIIGAVMGAAISAVLLWPRRGRTRAQMVFLGIIIALLMVWMAYTMIGFLSEREVESRAGSSGRAILSFLGAMIMGAFSGLFAVLKQLALPLGIGAVLGGLFRGEAV